MYSEATIFKRSSSQPYSIIDDEIVMLSIKNEEYYNFNLTATAIWKYISEPREFASIVDALINEFSIEREQCIQEVKPFLDELISLGIVEIYENQ